MQEKTHAQERFNQIGSILQALYEDRAAQRLEESEFTQLAATYREEKRKLQSLLEGGHLQWGGSFSLPAAPPTNCSILSSLTVGCCAG